MVHQANSKNSGKRLIKLIVVFIKLIVVEYYFKYSLEQVDSSLSKNQALIIN